MNLQTRRKFLAALAGAGAAGLAGLLWRREPAFAAAAEQQATVLPDPSAGRQFTNRLRLPGASGLYAAVAAKDVKQITVSELDFNVLPRVWSAFWAYVAEADGKRLLNPTLLAWPGDQIKLRMVNRLKQPMIMRAFSESIFTCSIATTWSTRTRG